jgi:hypothetical protein
MTAERAFLKKSLFIRYTSHYKFIAHIDGAQSPPSFYHKRPPTYKTYPCSHYYILSHQSGTLSQPGALARHCGGIRIVEAIERKDKPFAIGLQFHPEAALVKHLNHARNSRNFMDYDTALSFFKRIVQESVKITAKAA